MILGIIINLILSLWLIPEYLGSKRKIGYTWSLIACLFLTPLIGVIITLLSPKLNEYKKETIAIKKEQSKTDDSLQNLSDLKQKGILTDEEYRAKVSKINAEKDEQDLKNSLEYKQLKSLLDSGVLTKEEFESKVLILQSKADAVSDLKIQKTSDGFRVHLNNGRILNLKVEKQKTEGNPVTGYYNRCVIKYVETEYNYHLMLYSQKVVIKINNQKLYFKNTEEFIEYLVLQHLQ